MLKSKNICFLSSEIRKINLHKLLLALMSLRYYLLAGPLINFKQTQGSYFIHTEFSFAKLNDVDGINNALPSCHLTAQVNSISRRTC